MYLFVQTGTGITDAGEGATKDFCNVFRSNTNLDQVANTEFVFGDLWIKCTQSCCEIIVSFVNDLLKLSPAFFRERPEFIIPTDYLVK